MRQLVLLALLGVLACLALADVSRPAETFKVNLDLPPAKRWPWDQIMAHYNDSLHQAMKLMDSFIPTQYQAEVEALAEYVLLPQLGEYGEEIVSAVEVSKVPLGKAVILNLIYDIEAACTSIVAEDNNGHIYHGRNLDFLLAPTLRRLAIHVEFYRGGQLVFHGTTYAGYVGLLTGMRPGAFAISLDQRNDGTPSWENLLQEIFYHNTRTSAWLIRDTLDSSGLDYEGAVKKISGTPTPAPSYMIISGAKSGEGVVVTRWRDTTDIWPLDTQGSTNRWFLPQTNDDHWKPPKDNRRAAVIAGMNAIGRDKINLEGIFSVLSTPPVLARSTTYTTLMSAQSGNYTVWVRQLQL